MQRREFIRTAGTSLAGLAAAKPLFAGPRLSPLGANDDIRVAVAGIRAHGRSHINAYANMPGVRLVALCDVDDQVLDARVAEVDRQGIKVKAYRDIRALLDDPEIDAVSMATPNHWHALGTVWACQAGKDVCVEKPISHSVWEGRKMVEAARKYERMVQADLDARSGEDLSALGDFLRSGQLGKLVYVRTWNYIQRPSIGRVRGPQRIPDHIDYDLWMGPAPMSPLLRQTFHYDWHWQWATGNGEIANNGSHQLDRVRWVLGLPGLPRRVMSFGGRYGYVDDGQTPNTHTAVYDFDGVTVVYEARGLPRGNGSPHTDDFHGETVDGKPVFQAGPNSNGRHSGQAFFCEGGYVLDSVAYDNDGREIRRITGEPGGGGPQRHFVNALQSRRITDLKTDVLEGHLSVTFCHMGNLSFLAGEQVTFEQARKAVESNEHALRGLDRMTQHLIANGVDPSGENIVVGPALTMDGRTERFTGPDSERANMFLKDTYRPPFVIPDVV